MARILLAEDDKATREVIARALEADGHSVTQSLDGQEALDRLTAAPAGIDLLVSDVEMPGLDGVTLVERALAAQPRLKVLLISGFSGGLERAERLKGAGVRSVSKPFTLDALRSEVRALLG
ncbi:MAG TPA: response regulator [Hyphomicrobiaceae bacterium]|nr:response regulator [Hyphomicrobiaceae bacterium]